MSPCPETGRLTREVMFTTVETGEAESYGRNPIRTNDTCRAAVSSHGYFKQSGRAVRTTTTRWIARRARRAGRATSARMRAIPRAIIVRFADPAGAAAAG